MADIRELIAGLSEGIPHDVLNQVTNSLNEWKEDPMSPGLPLLMSLRDVFGLIKKSFATLRIGHVGVTNPEEGPSESTLGQPAQRGRKRKRDDESTWDLPPDASQLYKNVTAFIRAFTQAAKLKQFTDTSTVEYIVDSVVQLMEVECFTPFTGSKLKASPLVEVCVAMLYEVLIFGSDECLNSTVEEDGPTDSSAPGDSGGDTTNSGRSSLRLLVGAAKGISATSADVGQYLLRRLVRPLMGLQMANPLGGSAAEYVRDAVLRMLREYFDKPTPHSLIVVMQQICLSVTSRARADHRRLAAGAIACLFECLATRRQELVHFAEFLVAMSCHKEDKYRLFTVEVAVDVLVGELYAVGPHCTPIMKEQEEFALAATLLEILVLRCNDNTTNVRMKALCSIAVCMEHTEQCTRFKGVFSQFLKNGLQPPLRGWCESTETYHTILVSTVKCRLKEDKATVRRSAIHILEMIMGVEGVVLQNEYIIAALVEAASVHVDSSVAVRKQAVSCLIQMCRKAIHQCVTDFPTVEGPEASSTVEVVCLLDTPARILSKALLPAYLRDSEESVKKVVLGALTELIFAPLEDRSSVHPRERECVWQLLKLLPRDALLLLSRASTALAAQKEIKPGVIRSLQRQIRRDKTVEGAYELLADVGVSAFKSVLDPPLFVECYEERKDAMTNGTSDVTTFVHVLKLLRQAPPGKEESTRIATEIFEALQQVRCYHTLIPPLVTTMVSLCSNVSMAHDMASRLLAVARDRIQGYSKSTESQATRDVLACRYLLLIGDLGLAVEPGTGVTGDRNHRQLLRIPEHLETHLLALMQQPARPSGDQEASSVATDSFDQLQLSQMSTDSTGTQNTIGRALRDRSVSVTVQSCALISFGKLCLVKESLAKKFTCVFVGMLQKTHEEVLKTNILAVLADLCAAFSGSVDKYIPVLGWCIGDSSPLVRHTALALLTQLLAEGFIKWKSSLLYAFLVAVADDHQMVANFSENALLRVLHPKHPNLLFNNVIEALFVLNNYQGHPQYNHVQHRLHQSVYQLASADPRCLKKRMTVYRLMLGNMSAMMLYRLHEKLHTEVLSLCTEEGASEADFGSNVNMSAGFQCINALQGPGQRILVDTLNLLMSRELRLSARAPQATAGEDVPEGSGDALMEINRRVYAEMFQKHIELSVIPVIIDLRRWLRRHRSPVLGLLQEYLQCVMREYKAQIQTMLSADPQLALELEYDIASDQKRRRTTITSPHHRSSSSVDRRASLSMMKSDSDTCTTTTITVI